VRKGTMRRVALLACCLAACAALPEHRQLKTKRVECSEANEGDEIVFDCGGEFISTIKFASFGQPSGSCANPSGFTTKAGCHSKRTEGVIEDRCLGQTTCMFTVSTDLFGGDPCPSSSGTKKLAGVLACGSSLTAEEPVAEPPIIVHTPYGWRFIFFVFFVFGTYLTLGIAYNVKRNGATGMDAMPHIEMWKDLPFLVRDGIFFSIDTIKSKGKAQYQSYL